MNKHNLAYAIVVIVIAVIAIGLPLLMISLLLNTIKAFADCMSVTDGQSWDCLAKVLSL